MVDTDDTAIRKRAHQIWEDEGRPHGKHDEHWQRAASEVHGLEDFPQPDSVKKAATKPKTSAGRGSRSAKSAS